MNKFQWFETLLSCNKNYQLYCKANGSHLVMNTTSELQVLDMHSQHIDISRNFNGAYYYIKVNEKKMWIPILSGFSIFTSINNNIYQFSIEVNEEKKILFSWINFGENANDLSNTIASNAQPDRFQSFIKYINIRGKISIPNLLGFNINGIVQILISAVYQKYPHLYPNFQPIFKAQQATQKIIKVVKNKAKRLRKELDNNNSETLIREGLLITTEETKYIDYNDFIILLIENK
ncbi:hypothetical protein Glove_303g109 [Diversispora epigaea]|uniref:Uncharacterized protein n=1 Tax=Diversispora epigaea TaxID=1348612 RepID=A0A397HVF8_9GLOM|nr:hypothetical protein Glove_303g109 [Diversispora epigaea]